MTFLVRRSRPSFRLALAATVLYSAALVTWLSVVAPMNAILAQWNPGRIPENFAAVRNRWEAGHIAITGIKVVGLGCAIAAGLALGRPHVTVAGYGHAGDG